MAKSDSLKLVTVAFLAKDAFGPMRGSTAVISAMMLTIQAH